VPETWLGWFSLAMVPWVIGVGTWIVFDRRSPRATISWLLALAFLPLIGLAIYFLIGPRRFAKAKKRRGHARRVVAKSSGREQHSKQRRVSNEAQYLIAMCEAAAGESARPRAAEVEVYQTGIDKYAALERDIASARHHVHMEYYIWEPDGIGTRLRDCLAARAREGIEVRLLLDGFGSNGTSRKFWQPLTDAGGIVEFFNAVSFRVMRHRLANFRTHRKIVVIDGEVGFVGGMNVTDVHTCEFSKGSAWRDVHLRLQGSAVRGLQMLFCEAWHYATGEAPEGSRYFPNHEPPEDDGSHTVQIVASGPDENRDAIHKLFFSSIASAHERVYLTTPYFVPDEAIFYAMATAVLRGADVRLLVPAKNDLRLVAAASRSYYPDLFDAGIRVFEYEPTMLHAKTLVVDDLVAIVGTANADPRSFKLNFEVVVASYEKEATEALASGFHRDLEQSREITEEVIGRYSIGRRLLQNFSRLLSPVL